MTLKSAWFYVVRILRWRAEQRIYVIWWHFNLLFRMNVTGCDGAVSRMRTMCGNAVGFLFVVRYNLDNILSGSTKSNSTETNNLDIVCVWFLTYSDGNLLIQIANATIILWDLINAFYFYLIFNFLLSNATAFIITKVNFFIIYRLRQHNFLFFKGLK